MRRSAHHSAHAVHTCARVLSALTAPREMASLVSALRPGLFAGTTTVVTGGGTGIGFAIARELTELGGRVVLAGRREAPLLAAVEALAGGKAASEAAVTHRTCNVRDEEQVRALMEHAVASFGSLDNLVNNAGGQFPSPAVSISRKGWDAVIETNLTGTFLCCREAHSGGLAASGRAAGAGGAIVNIIADMFSGFPNMAHTGAARSAVDNLTKSLSLEWAADGVRVNAVAPGVIYSDSAAANYPDGWLASVADQLPAHRLGTPEEVSAAVCWLLSPAARYVSGATLRVDGASSLYHRTAFKVPPHDRMGPLDAASPEA